jgi:cob(I)alamin adenosyltransferase
MSQDIESLDDDIAVTLELLQTVLGKIDGLNANLGALRHHIRDAYRDASPSDHSFKHLNEIQRSLNSLRKHVESDYEDLAYK